MGTVEKKPKYQQVADALGQQIKAGQLKPGDRLPSINEMIAAYGISLHTVGKVHDALRAEGLIRRERGRGVFVDDSPKSTATNFLAYFCHDYRATKNQSYHAILQHGVRQAAHEAGKSLTIVEEPKDFPHWSLMEGVLISDLGEYDRTQLKALLPANLPCVNMMFNDPGFHSVMADDAGGMRQAVEALIAAGHQRIGYLSHLRHAILRERHQALLGTMENHGLPVQDNWVYSKVIPTFRTYREYGYEAMQQWLRDGWEELKLTAILAHNDPAALGMIEALSEHGLRVPEDISIVGFDGALEEGTSSLELSTVQIPLREIGKTAVQVLLDLQKTQSGQRTIVQLDAHFQAGNTIRNIA